MFKTFFLTLTLAVLATAQTYNITSGAHNGPAVYYEAQAAAYNSISGITAYASQGRVENGIQWIPAVSGPAIYCAPGFYGAWSAVDDPNIGPNGQVWTRSCQTAPDPMTGVVTTLTTTLHTTWTLYSFATEGRHYWEKRYTVQPQSTDNMGNSIYSNVQITQ